MKIVNKLVWAGLTAIAAGAAGTICKAFKDLNKFAHKEIAVGDLVQWTSNGKDMFDAPRRVRDVMDSKWGKYALVEGSETGLPVKQLRIV